MERVEELTKDKVRLVEEYEAKLGKAQECYERELEAMRRTHQLTTENLLAWKRTEVRDPPPRCPLNSAPRFRVCDDVTASVSAPCKTVLTDLLLLLLPSSFAKKQHLTY